MKIWSDGDVGLKFDKHTAVFSGRFFEEVESEHKFLPNVKTTLPTRSDSRSAGYDFYAKENYILKPGESVAIYTDVKAFMQPDECLVISPRSSVGIKLSLMLKNTMGIIDASYYCNPKNDGNIIVCLYNYSDQEATILAGERFAQGIFQKYLTTDDDQPTNLTRLGGSGSSGK